MEKIIFTFAFVGIAALAWFTRPQGKTAPVAAPKYEYIPGSIDTPAKKVAESRRIKLRLLENSHANPHTFNKQINETDCTDLWAAIENFPFAAMNQTGDQIKMPPMPSCQKIPSGIRQAHDAFTKECGDISGKPPKSKGDFHFQTCISLMLIYRAAIRDWATQDVNVETSTDLSLLMDKLMSAVSRSNPHQIEKAAMRLHELEPNFYEPIKAIVISKLISVFQEENEKSRGEALNLLERSLVDAKSFGIYDPELLQAEVLLKTRGLQDMEALEAEGKQMIKDFPTRGFGDYAISAAMFKKKDFEGAKAHLQSALEKEPQNEQFKATLKELEEDPQNFDRKIFRIALGFHIDFNDQNEVVLKQH